MYVNKKWKNNESQFLGETIKSEIKKKSVKKVKCYRHKHIEAVRWKQLSMGRVGLRREGVKPFPPATAQVHHVSPPGCESLHAGETFNSLEMEAHYPQ